MNYIEQIKQYIPYNEQETKDKELILQLSQNFPDLLYRENEIAHMTASAWIVNHTYDKVLMVYHKIYDSWSWTGGHADGDGDLLHVAIKEAKEETGLVYLTPVSNTIFSLESLCVNGHVKGGKYVSSHLHLNVTYLLEADEAQKLISNESENSGVRWFTFSESLKYPTEPWMVDTIYRKLNEKLKKIMK